MSHVMAIRDTCFNVSFEGIMKDLNYKDVTIVGSNGKIHAHRVVLALASSFFKGILENMCPAMDCCIIIPDYTVEFLAGWLTHLYNGVWDPQPQDTKSFEAFRKMINLDSSQVCYTETDMDCMNLIRPEIEYPVIEVDEPEPEEELVMPRIVDTYTIKVERNEDMVQSGKEDHAVTPQVNCVTPQVNGEIDEHDNESGNEVLDSGKGNESRLNISRVYDDEDDGRGVDDQAELDTYERLMAMNQEICKELMEEEISDSEYANYEEGSPRKSPPIHKKKPKTEKCTVCQQKFSKSGFAKHVKTHTSNGLPKPPQTFTCDHCKEEFKQPSIYNRHVKGCDGDKYNEKDKKGIIGKRTSTKIDTSLPSTSKENGNLVEQRKRGRASKDNEKNKRSKSSTSTSDETKDTVNVPSPSYPKSKIKECLPLKIKLSSKTVTFICPECNEDFHSEIVLQQHINGVHDMERLQKLPKKQPQVEKSKKEDATPKPPSGTKSSLKPENHPFHCTFCAKSFQYEFEFNKHFVSHVPMPFDCLVCGDTYQVRKLLLAHIDTHYASVEKESA